MFFDRVPPEQVTYIFDNGPRNKEIIKRMYDVIEKDYNLEKCQIVCDIKTLMI